MLKKLSFAGIGIALLVAPALASAASTNCVTLMKTLSFGSRGADVTSLQTFFVNEYKDFPTPTGYFGPITQAAVKQWQASHGIVSSGAPSTTGYGQTGPKTRKAMACAGAGTNSGASFRSTAKVTATKSIKSTNIPPASGQQGIGVRSVTQTAPSTSSSGSAVTTNSNSDLSGDLNQLDSQVSGTSDASAAIDQGLNDQPIQQVAL